MNLQHYSNFLVLFFYRMVISGRILQMNRFILPQSIWKYLTLSLQHLTGSSLFLELDYLFLITIFEIFRVFKLIFEVDSFFFCWGFRIVWKVKVMSMLSNTMQRWFLLPTLSFVASVGWYVLIVLVICRQKLRRLEVALIEYRESLEERGIKSSEEIERKVAIHRKRLQSEYGLSDSNEDVSWNSKCLFCKWWKYPWL